MLELITKHLSTNNIKINIHKNLDTICAFTGKKITEGVLLKDLIKTLFTDFEYIKFISDYASTEIALSMENWEGRAGLRNYSFVANTEKLQLLKREEISDYLFSPPKPPFYFAVTFSQKKHIAFKSKVNLSSTNYVITTDLGDVLIDTEKIKELWEIMQKWYTIQKGKENSSTQPTKFNKSNILGEKPNHSNIVEYGILSYLKEDKIIEPFRNTLLLKLLTHILNKQC